MRSKEVPDKIMRVYTGFDKELKDIARQRIIQEKDDHTRSTSRLTAAIIRHPAWPTIKHDMIKSPLVPFFKDKKGSIGRMTGIFMGLVIFIIVAIAVVLIGGPVLFSMSTITNSLTSLGTVGVYNLTSYAQTTFGNINAALQQIRWISFVLLFGFILGIFVSFFMVRAQPWLFGIYVILAIVVEVFSIFLAKSYENILNTGGPITSTFTSFTGTNWFILNLPYVIGVIAFIGAIFLFIAIPRENTF